MQKLIRTNWLLIAVAASAGAIYITVTEGFIEGKGYALLVLALITFLAWYRKK